MKPFVGFLPLYRIAVKENARLVAPWIIVISLLCVTSFLAYAWIFPHTADREELAHTIGSNPAFSLIFGQASNLLTADGFNAWRALALGCFFAGLMTIFLVVRETRGKEDTGEAEMIGANVVGRYTQLAVAVTLGTVASSILAIVTSTVTIASGGAVHSSVVLALTFMASGILFTGVGAIAGQLGSYRTTATSMAVTFLGISFLLRGYADTSPNTDWVLWLTPFGWLQKVDPAGTGELWPLVICLMTAVLLTLVSGLLLGRRDYGMGVFPQRKGRNRARFVNMVSGLTLRLQTEPIFTWTIAFVLLGTVFGFLLSSLGDVFAQNTSIEKLFSMGRLHIDFAFEFIRMLLKILGVIAAVYGVQVMMRFYNEEMNMRVDPLLAGTATRKKLYASHVVVALVGPALALIAASCMIALVSFLRGANINEGRIIWQATTEIVAVWVLIAFSVGLIGIHPIARLLAWLAVVVSFALTLFGPMLKLWDSVQGISPLWHVPNVNDASPDWMPLLWLGILVLLFLFFGFVGFRRRDIARSID